MSKGRAVAQAEQQQVSYSRRSGDDGSGDQKENGDTIEIRFRISAASDAHSGLSVVGNTVELGEWDVSRSVRLKAVKGEQGADVVILGLIIVDFGRIETQCGMCCTPTVSSGLKQVGICVLQDVRKKKARTGPPCGFRMY